MTIIYRADIGQPLTSEQVDDNFHDLDDRTTDLEDNPPVAVGIANFVVNGKMMTIFLTNGSSFGPYTLPTAMPLWRGEWIPATGYFEYDLVLNGALGLYIVLQNHVSGDVFDAGAENSDEPIYQRIVGPFNMALAIIGVSESPFTLTAAYGNKYTMSQYGGVLEVIVPNDDSQEIDVLTEFHFRQASGGGEAIEFNPEDEEVEIQGMDGFLNLTGGGGALATLKKVGPNVWWLYGRLEPTTVDETS